jgi:amino acid transporter
MAFEVGVGLILAVIVLFHVGQRGGLTLKPFTLGAIPQGGNLAIGVILAVLAIINSGARVAYKVGYDGLLPRWIAWLHPLRLNPVAAITAICVFGLVLGLVLGFTMGPLTAFGEP